MSTVWTSVRKKQNWVVGTVGNIQKYFEKETKTKNAFPRYILGLGEISQADLNFKIKTRPFGIG